MEQLLRAGGAHFITRWSPQLAAQSPTFYYMFDWLLGPLTRRQGGEFEHNRQEALRIVARTFNRIFESLAQQHGHLPQLTGEMVAEMMGRLSSTAYSSILPSLLSKTLPLHCADAVSRDLERLACCHPIAADAAILLSCTVLHAALCSPEQAA
jgi:hypothetical protein